VIRTVKIMITFENSDFYLSDSAIESVKKSNKNIFDCTIISYGSMGNECDVDSCECDGTFDDVCNAQISWAKEYASGDPVYNVDKDKRTINKQLDELPIYVKDCDIFIVIDRLKKIRWIQPANCLRKNIE